jgi:hypothetical protein
MPSLSTIRAFTYGTTLGGITVEIHLWRSPAPRVALAAVVESDESKVSLLTVRLWRQFVYRKHMLNVRSLVLYRTT